MDQAQVMPLSLMLENYSIVCNAVYSCTYKLFFLVASHTLSSLPLMVLFVSFLQGLFAKPHREVDSKK